jgi:hypothetical protein
MVTLTRLMLPLTYIASFSFIYADIKFNSIDMTGDVPFINFDNVNKGISKA